MKKVILIFLVLINFVTLSGCASISKENFIKDVSRLSQERKISAPITLPQAKHYDANEKYKILYNKIFSDPVTSSAIYDEAAREDKSWSVESIITSNWHQALLNRGLSNLPDNDKIELIKLISKAFSTASPAECSGLKSNTNNIFTVFNESDADKFMQIEYNAIYSGAVAKPKNATKAKKEAYVALLVLAGKLKDGFTDEELGDILYPFIEKQKTPAKMDCKVIGKIVHLTTLLEPKYRTFLFNAVDFR